jgi:hypothetical protein
MATHMSIEFGTLSRLLAVAAGALYAGIVLMRLRTDRPHYRLSFELRDPGRWVENLVIWPGVKVSEGCLRIASCILNILLEASAEVGEWFMRRSPAVVERIRARFLV